MIHHSIIFTSSTLFFRYERCFKRKELYNNMTSFVPYSSFSMQTQGSADELTASDLFHHTGLGIKLRFLFSLTFIALVPAMILVLLLGDPGGQEQQESLGQALFLRVQIQAAALNQAFAWRQASLTALAAHPAFSMRPNQPDPFSGQPGGGIALSSAQAVLQTAQRADPASLDWLLLDANHIVIATGLPKDRLLGTALSHLAFASDHTQFARFVQQAAAHTTSPASLFGTDPQTQQAWVAYALPVADDMAPHHLLLALFSLAQMTQAVMTPATTLPGTTTLLLDHAYRLLASAGPLASAPHLLAPLSPALQTLPLDTARPLLLPDDPLTGQTDLAVGASLASIQGYALILVPRGTLLAPSSRSVFAGRNTPLLILAMLVAVALVATWVALPIVRPIRRATRGITEATDAVLLLATNAQRLAREHQVGTTLLRQVSHRLSLRRQSLIRDTRLITQTCQACFPRITFLMRMHQGNVQPQKTPGHTQGPHTSSEMVPRQYAEALRGVEQGIRQMYEVAMAISSALEQDEALKQLDQAMDGAGEISLQFQQAGEQLAQEAQQLVRAAHSLI
jgi:hypothetical protein